ncbi:MAG: hypothetical protein RH942_03440 [Kiloniellaceae bacterium]
MFGNWTDRISGQPFNMMTDRVDCVAPDSIEDLWRDCEESLRHDAA